PEVIPIIGEIEQVFWARPLSAGMLVAILVAIVLMSIYLYRRPWGLPGWLRASLIVVRVLVLALVVATLLEPTAVVTETHTQVRSLPVLLDVSESMSMQDQRKRSDDLVDAAAALDMVSLQQAADPDRAVMGLNAKQRQAITAASRLDLGTAILSQSGRPVFESLGESLDLSYHVFGQSPRLLSDEDHLTSEDLAGLKADEPGTSIATSLEAVANSGGIPPAGIILLSDGIGNATSQRSEAVLQDLGARGIPVYTVPLGLPNPDDVSIRNIVMQEVAFSGDRVPVRVHLQSEGYEQRTARLSVLLDDRRVSSRVVRLAGGLQFEDVDFRVDVYEKGATKIDVVIEPFDDEVSTANNRVTRSIRVVNEKVNVLYIEGNARWEFRYLRAILKRDPRINATFIASNVGPEVARNSPEHIECFPDKLEEAFKYDLVILGDVNASFFTDEEFSLLERLIRDRGASLLMLCGPMHSPGSYAGTPVESMLPVRFDSEAKWEKIAESVYPVLTPEGQSSLVMTLENEVDLNDRIWSRMAPMDQLPPLLSAKPAATVLAVLSDSTARNQSYPLVAWQRYGTGKCMSIASDRLWRLRYKTGDKYHWRVWSQCIQFMTLSRLMGEHKRIRLETDRAVYAVDGQCRLYAHVLDDNFEPINQPGFQVYVTNVADGQAKELVTLRQDKSQPGLYEGYFTPPKAGRYRLEANENDKRISSTTEFQVSDVRQELLDTGTRPDRLQHISNLTGGTMLNVRELGDLPDLIASDPATITVRSERPLWDNMLVVLLVVGLLGAEWILRRRYDLP
ncbi:MAG: hypothetical protein KJO79_04545, partial [Verrucomicrobiae bacterium]|nr:hypothetical protein [Verrucomicrobiae bacterium]NNJ86426.1 hypothetical protein [Akkermansiaceae bacterium]